MFLKVHIQYASTMQMRVAIVKDCWVGKIGDNHTMYPEK